METHVIDRAELKSALDRGDRITLVMAMSDWAYTAAHIPGSPRIPALTEGAIRVHPDDEIVVYCAGSACPLSLAACRRLTRLGFANVRRFPGGLEAWVAAGYPLEDAHMA